jgi:hypothetical protein
VLVVQVNAAAGRHGLTRFLQGFLCDRLKVRPFGIPLQLKSNGLRTMALRKVNKLPDPSDDERRQEIAPAIKTCPICEGQMEVVYHRHGQQVLVCVDCHSGLTVPAGAWNIARVKREAKWMPEP